jgi:hypothetical protein
MPRINDVLRRRVVAAIAFPIVRVPEKNASYRVRGEFVGSSGERIRIPKASKNM